MADRLKPSAGASDLVHGSMITDAMLRGTGAVIKLLYAFDLPFAELQPDDVL